MLRTFAMPDGWSVSRGKRARAVPVPFADLEKLVFDRSGGGTSFSISFLITFLIPSHYESNLSVQRGR